MAIYDLETKGFLCECGCKRECEPWNSYRIRGEKVERTYEWESFYGGKVPYKEELNSI